MRSTSYPKGPTPVNQRSPNGTRDESQREIVISRVFDAPRALVFQAWTDSKHVAQWWGPSGFSNTLSEMEVRPGGVWQFVMHGPDGAEYKNQISYLEIVKPERLVYAHSGDEAVGSTQFHVTVSFAEIGNQTRLTMRMLFDSAEERDRAEAFGAVRGGNQTLDRLAGFLIDQGGVSA
ncbi:SRPBCC family protein [Candidatus Laterigemmans baculatus]|uniref:SRPBCC family protein n=1 Tax=Candidatus Laterigemmans baculatus TaxID=2770505 RepID=UPI0013DC7F7E|nr:SRPBCC family protein [Candidatus Laterigemmans baculatus]